MEFPPQDWTRAPKADYHTYKVETNRGLAVDLIMDMEGLATESFRFVLGGKALLKIAFAVKDILGDQFPDFTIKWPIWPADITLRNNMATGPWIDVEQLIGGNDVEVLADSTSVDPSHALLTLIQSQEAGASVRWALAIGDSGRLTLQLQALPMMATALQSKPSLRGK